MCEVTSIVRLFTTLWTITTCQAPLSMGFSKQEYWSGLPCPPSENLDLEIKPAFPGSPALAGRLFHLGSPIKGKKKESFSFPYPFQPICLSLSPSFSHCLLGTRIGAESNSGGPQALSQRPKPHIHSLHQSRMFQGPS